MSTINDFNSNITKLKQLISRPLYLNTFYRSGNQDLKNIIQSQQKFNEELLELISDMQKQIGQK